MAHVLVKRIAGAIETENEVARGLGIIRDPDAWVVVLGGASEAHVRLGTEGVSIDGDGG